MKYLFGHRYRQIKEGVVNPGFFSFVIVACWKQRAFERKAILFDYRSKNSFESKESSEIWTDSPDSLVSRFGLLSKHHSEDVPVEICRHILEDNKLIEWQLGKSKVFLKYYHPERLEKLMSKYRDAALLIQRSKFDCNKKFSLHPIFYLGLRGHLARKQFKQLKLTAKGYQNEIQQFCASIEGMNQQLLQQLNQLNDKLPGLIVFSRKFDLNCAVGKEVPVPPPESDIRPRPPLRESSLHPPPHIMNNGIAGKYSLPTAKVSSSTPSSSLASTDLLVDYDSLLSYLTLKYGSPGERESCLR